MRVLSSGGGIAGLTLANMLHQHGIVSVVIEQAADLRQDGYAIDFLAPATRSPREWVSLTGSSLRAFLSTVSST